MTDDTQPTLGEAMETLERFLVNVPHDVAAAWAVVREAIAHEF